MLAVLLLRVSVMSSMLARAAASPSAWIGELKMVSFVIGVGRVTLKNVSVGAPVLTSFVVEVPSLLLESLPSEGEGRPSSVLGHRDE